MLLKLFVFCLISFNFHFTAYTIIEGMSKEMKRATSRKNKNLIQI